MRESRKRIGIIFNKLIGMQAGCLRERVPLWDEICILNKKVVNWHCLYQVDTNKRLLLPITNQPITNGIFRLDPQSDFTNTPMANDLLKC